MFTILSRPPSNLPLSFCSSPLSALFSAAMGFLRSISFLVLMSLSLMCCSQARLYYVGGDEGWVVKPKESFNHWAERERFKLNDILVFTYKKDMDSVLMVKSRKDYERCNTKNPVKKLENGYSVFELDRSGPFFFISGEHGHCEKGQKLIVVVLASPPSPPTPSNPPKASPSPSPSPSPSIPSPSSPPKSSPSPSPSTPSPSSPSPSPWTPSPSPPPKASPSPSPSTPSPSSPPTASSSPSPSTPSPSSPPTASPSPSPSTPSPSSPPTASPSPSPSTPSPSSPPESSPSPSPSTRPPSSSPTPSPTNEGPSTSPSVPPGSEDSYAPAPSPAVSSSFSTSVPLISALCVGAVVSLVISSFVGPS